MSTRQVTICSATEILWALLVLTAAFLCLETSFFIQSLHSVVKGFSLETSQLFSPRLILPDLLSFIATFIFIHLAYTFFVWTLSISLISPRVNSLYISMSIWFIGIITLLLANTIYFPNSRFSMLINTCVPAMLILPLFYLFMGACAAILLLAVISILLKAWQRPYISLTVGIFIASNLYLLHMRTAVPVIIHDAASTTRPNIIFVGIDSLRPDFLGYFGNERPTPFIDSFLKSASVFSDAVTPLARTYPSWVSILTGKHPVATGARTNLANRLNIHYTPSLPGMLQKIGYHTIYATDEVRFNNIDQYYDFNVAITPPIGINDFIIGSANDFPMSNLLMDSRFGQWLFPYNYGNRPSFFNYNPDSFVRILSENIPDNRQQPQFITVHFCLPHHPFRWASFNAAGKEPREWYAASVERVDQQIDNFFHILKKKKLLEHAIVVLLSDHGEALGIDGDRITEKDLYVQPQPARSMPAFYPQGKDFQPVNISGGHGTDVLGLPQYHSLLAFKLYGTGFQQIGIIPGVVSLIDIKPTILDILKIKHRIKTALAGTQGQSLAYIVEGKSRQVPIRHIFLESAFSPKSIRTLYPDEKEVFLEGIKMFEFNPENARIIFKPSRLRSVINNKQFADIYDHWMLALYPQENKIRMPILVDLTTGQWTEDMASDFARQSPAKEMKQRLETFYFDDLHSA